MALVVETETLSPGRISDLRVTKNDLLRLASGRAPYRLVLAVPELEAAFFHDPAVLERALGRPVPRESRILARMLPREALHELLAQGGPVATMDDLLRALTEPDLEVIRQTPYLRELTDFLRLARDWAAGNVKAAG